MAQPQGIDVSHWQGDVDWAKVRAAGKVAAWAKASQGANIKDSRWSEGRRKAAADAGVHLGAYCFADLTQSPAANAKNLLDAIGGVIRRGELLPALDVESGGLTNSMSAQSIVQWCNAFAFEFGKTITGPLVLYTDHGTLINRMAGGKGLQQAFPYLWIARYTNAADPGETGVWPTWHAWQYSQTGTCDGIAGNVDLDRFRDDAALTALVVQ